MAQPTKMPFPGESPTIALAMAAGEQYGFHEEAKPKKAAAKRAKPKKAARKSASPARGGAKAKPRKAR